MIDLPLTALTRAWVTTTIAACLLLLALTVAQFGQRGYLHDLQQAIQLTREQPPPDFVGDYGEDIAIAHTPPASHTGPQRTEPVGWAAPNRLGAL